MANPDQHSSENPEQRPVPDPHRGEVTPDPDPHMREEAEGNIVRPDQQEELGPVGELMHAASVEATAEVTGDPEAEAEAERLGVEGEGVEAAQIFTVMLATAISLALAVVAVFVLVEVYADGESVARANVELYPELREVERAFAEIQNYSRTDSLYRLPIDVAMNQVAEAYASQNADVSAPENFATLYVDAVREADIARRESSMNEAGSPTQSPDTNAPADGGADAEPGTEEEASSVNTEEGDEPEDR